MIRRAVLFELKKAKKSKIYMAAAGRPADAIKTLIHIHIHLFQLFIFSTSTFSFRYCLHNVHIK